LNRPRALQTLAVLIALAGCALPAQALASDIEPGEVVVAFKAGSTAHAAAVHGSAPQVLRVRNVSDALRGLRARPDVRYAVPNYKARIAQAAAGSEPFYPNDKGAPGSGGWDQIQWNFVGPFGVGAPQAWANAILAGRPGGRGVTIAVLDTGVAYANRPPYRISPDFARSQFVKGYDFVDHDPYPFDRNGHGTHVAGTLAEETNNGIGLTGLAYGARLMPVRVLDKAGEGNAGDIAAGIRFAARHGAQVINLSLEFDSEVTASDIPQLLDAIAFAKRRGAVVIAASGNEAGAKVAYPARARDVMSVGATTENGCLSEFSNIGSGLDLVAPGGGADRAIDGDANCKPDGPSGRNIEQITLLGDSVSEFGLPDSYEGTSMAVPHVAATAALIIATGSAGPHPTPKQIERHMEQTARDLGPKGYDRRYGWGLLDAAAATAPPSTGQ
jgi:serine protease